jgi:hypothetical protein
MMVGRLWAHRQDSSLPWLCCPSATSSEQWPRCLWCRSLKEFRNIIYCEFRHNKKSQHACHPHNKSRGSAILQCFMSFETAYLRGPTFSGAWRLEGPRSNPEWLWHLGRRKSRKPAKATTPIKGPP